MNYKKYVESQLGLAKTVMEHLNAEYPRLAQPLDWTSTNVFKLEQAKAHAAVCFWTKELEKIEKQKNDSPQMPSY